MDALAVAPRSASRKGADLRYVTEISLSDVVTGVEKQIEFETDKDCGSCKGSGSEGGAKPEVCSSCNGTVKL